MPRLILAYHGVGDYQNPQWIEYGRDKYDLKGLSVSPRSFEKQLACLRGRDVMITFDDGFENVFSVARPILQKYGWRATIFLITDKIGNKDFLSWEQILQMKKEGFSFGSHTCSHPNLTLLPPEEAKREIVDSKKIIEEKLDKRIEFFCYPYGKFNKEIEKIVKEAGFLGAVITPSGPGVKESPYSLKRVGINSNNSMSVFKFKVSGVFSWLREQKLLWKITKSLKQKKLVF